jgi:hypothetical protein
MVARYTYIDANGHSQIGVVCSDCFESFRVKHKDVGFLGYNKKRKALHCMICGRDRDGNMAANLSMCRDIVDKRGGTLAPHLVKGLEAKRDEHNGIAAECERILRKNEEREIANR